MSREALNTVLDRACLRQAPLEQQHAMHTPLSIHYFGMVKSVMSWAHVAREMVLALDAQGCDVSITNCRGHLYNGKLSIDPRLLTLMNRERHTDIEITFDYPLNYPRLLGKRKVGLLVYESTVVPPAWIDHINRCLDLLVVPSRFCRDLMIANGVPDAKVRVIPYGVNPAVFRPDAEPLPFGTDKKFIFLTVAMPHARKGLDILISAFTEEFSAGDDAALVIKTPYAPFKNRKHWEIDIEEMINANTKAGAPEIIYIRKEEDPHMMPRYYAGCGCYLQPSLCEGFGIAILEAMAMKKPVITTGWGGQTDFCSEENSFLIHYALQNAGNAQYDHIAPDAQIAVPDKADLKRLMRFVYEHPDEAGKKAKKGYTAAQGLTWENAARMLIETITRLFPLEKKGGSGLYKQHTPPSPPFIKGDLLHEIHRN